MIRMRMNVQNDAVVVGVKLTGGFIFSRPVPGVPLS